MTSELIPLNFSKILQSKAYTAIVLGNDTKRFAIYTEPQIGKVFLSLLMEEKRPRPLSHELFFSILDNLSVKVIQMVIHGLEDTIYMARLFLEQEVGPTRTIIEIDARPSDAIMLALISSAPMFCRQEVLDQAIVFQD